MFGYQLVREKDMEEQSILISDRLTELESEIIDQKYIIQGLEKELKKTRADLEHKDQLSIDMRDIDFSILSTSNPKLIKELFDLCRICQHTIVAQSLKIRKVDGIAYRDGAFDGIEILKSKFKEFFKKTSEVRKTSNET